MTDTPPAPPSTADQWLVWAKDTGERAFWTFIEALIAYMIVKNELGLTWGAVAASGGLTAAFNVLKQALMGLTPIKITNPILDFVHRVGVSFGIAFLTSLILVPAFELASVSAWQAAAAGGLVAALAAIKGIAADRLRPGTVTPMSTVAPPQPLPAAA